MSIHILSDAERAHGQSGRKGLPTSTRLHLYSESRGGRTRWRMGKGRKKRGSESKALRFFIW